MHLFVDNGYMGCQQDWAIFGSAVCLSSQMVSYIFYKHAAPADLHIKHTVQFEFMLGQTAEDFSPGGLEWLRNKDQPSAPAIVAGSRLSIRNHRINLLEIIAKFRWC